MVHVCNIVFEMSVSLWETGWDEVGDRLGWTTFPVGFVYTCILYKASDDKVWARHYYQILHSPNQSAKAWASSNAKERTPELEGTVFISEVHVILYGAGSISSQGS